MPPDALETLRQVNDRLRSALVRLRPEQRDCSTITARDLSDLLGEIVRAAECLRHASCHSEATLALEEESLEYRCNLEKLDNFLPDLHARLLAERARLESAQSHVAAAVAWVRASKVTL